ncbi:MAG: BatD family protein [Lysobacteraceae bacterium]
MKSIRILIALLLCCIAMQATAAVRATVDRARVAAGDNVVLTVTSDASDAQPNFAPLVADFDVRGTSSGRQTTIFNGSMRSSMQWSIVLTPKHAGTITIPALTVGGEQTQPVQLDVSAQELPQAPDSAAAGAASGAPVFIETSITPVNPYAQQAMIYTLRLYYAVTLVDGSLPVPTSDNGDLRQIGDDATSQTIVQGRRYTVVERNYLLQPEHSGAMHIVSPTFHGRALGDIDNLFDDGASANNGDLRAVGKTLDVQVRARPENAGDPWIPARMLTMNIEPSNAPVHAGDPFSIVVTIDGEGVTAAQLPEIALPTIAGAQIYPEPSTTTERLRNGQLFAERVRRFAIVPAQAGDLKMPDLTMPWWDIINDRAALARASSPVLHVLPGTAIQNESGASATPKNGAERTTVTTASSALANAASLRIWQIATCVSAALLALALWWGWRRGRGAAAVPAQATIANDRIPNRAPSLHRALALGDASAITQSLLEAMPRGPARNLGEVAQQLADPTQREAVRAFDAARWSADVAAPASALAALRSAFKSAPHWTGRIAATARDTSLPPLYPS